MGSIHNLLNPLSTPSPRRLMSSNREEGGDDNEGDRDGIVSLDVEAEYYTPIESAKMRTNGKDDKIHGQTGIREMRPDLTQTGSSEIQLEETRPRLLEVRSEEGKVDVRRNRMEEVFRRTSSSSSLADILNPLEEPPVTPAYQSPRDTSIIIPITQTPTDRQQQSVTTQVDSTKDAEHDEEMIDVVRVNEETEGADSSAMKDVIITGEAIRQSGSTDSQLAKDEPVTNLAQPTDTKSPVPSRTPSPSKKRKYTPESSPDAPLFHELQHQPPPSHIEPDLQAQISVEKPKAGSRVTKTSRAPPKHLNPRPNKAAKKKPKTNGEKKKQGPKPKEKSPSVGLEEVLPSHVQTNIRVHQRDNPVLPPLLRHPHLTKVATEIQNNSIVFVVNPIKGHG